MKKILALVLAVAMLSVTAFAAEITNSGSAVSANPGSDHTFNRALFVDGGSDLSGVAANTGKFTSEYFTVATKKFDKGANLVKSIAFNDDDGELEIEFVQNYDQKAPVSANVIIKDLSLKAKKEVKISGTVEARKNQTFDWIGDTEFIVGYVETDYLFAAGASIANDTLVKFKKSADGQTVYDTVDFSFNELYIEGRAYDGDRVFFKGSSTPNTAEKEILRANSDADIRFLNFSTNGLPSNFDVQLSFEKEDLIYELNDSGKLVASSLKWSEDDYAWVGKIRSAKQYVISDIKLNAAAPDTATTPDVSNPETGANDVVGIAAALAVVSLVAAGAVSLKK